MRLPNFLIVGTMKSGTTTLRDYLGTHPEVYLAPGEVQFFADDELYGRGLGWYESQFAGAGAARFIGEKCGTYCYYPRAAERLHSHLPNAKLIWLFREPIARAYSNYWHAVSRGKERLSFEDAVAREPTRGPWRSYLQRSRYVDQVRNLLALYPREQMYFALFEDLASSPLSVLSGICRFLGVAPLESVSSQRSNVTVIPRSRHVAWFAKRYLDGTFPRRVIDRVNRRTKPGYPRLDAGLRTRLQADFVAHNLELAELTGLDLSAWSRK